MIDPWIAFGLALLGGALLSTEPLPTAVALVGLGIVGRRSLSRTLVVVLGGIVALGAVRAGRAVERFEVARVSARDALGAPVRCEARAQVVSSPMGQHGVLRWDAELDQVVCDGRALAVPLRARLYGGPEDLARGDTLFVVASLAAVQLFRNDGLGDPATTAARAGVVASGGVVDARIVGRGVGPPAFVDRMRAAVRARIARTFAPGAEPMARALVLGESDLDPADDEAFRASGLSHLLAVSGTHLVVVVAGAVAVLGALLRRIEPLAARFDTGRLGAFAGALLAWAYADFAGGSGSARRAAAMFSFALGARALGRRSRGPRAFGLSMVLLALADPLVAFDLSFTLSLAATSGLLVLLRPLEAQLSEPLPLRIRPIAKALATTLAATIACAPLLAGIAPTLPLGGLLANLVAVPIGELFALPLCLAHAAVAWLPAAEKGLAIVGSGSLLVVRAIARASASATWLALPVPRPNGWQLAILGVLAAGLLALPGRRRVVGAAGLGLLLASEASAISLGRPRGKLRITFLDVGQGDSTLVDFPDGRAMLVDGGGFVGSPVDPGLQVVLPMLRARRRKELAVAVLSHPHPDHFLGLASALPRLGVGELWDTGQGELEGAGMTYAGLLAGLRSRGVPIRRPDALCGAPRAFGAATVEVLAPCPGPVPLLGANDNSLVLRVSLGARAALLVGDAEHDEEARMLASAPGLLGADVLKIGHHGSRTSSTAAFLAAVHPEATVISCGVRNRFGHPHPLTLAALSRAHTRVLRTDRGGSVVWETDGATSSFRRAAGSD